MLHRTNEAMNGLSGRLDKLLAHAVENSAAQSKQQKTMAWLTFVIAAATIIYTVTTVYATHETVRAQQASAASPAKIEYVRGSGAVPESAAVTEDTSKESATRSSVDIRCDAHAQVDSDS